MSRSADPKTNYLGDFQGFQGKARGKARGPEHLGRAAGAPVPLCSGPLAFPVAFPWTPRKSPQLLCLREALEDLGLGEALEGFEGLIRHFKRPYEAN